MRSWELYLQYTAMKLISSLLFLFLVRPSFGQSTDPATEQSIIRETLCQYLNTNPNSAASFLKANKGYALMTDYYKHHIQQKLFKNKKDAGNKRIDKDEAA